MAGLLQYLRDNWDSLGPEFTLHLQQVAVTMVTATVIGLALGVVAARTTWLGTLILATASVIITIPSFALFGLLSIWFSLGSTPVVIGLVLYALLPVVRNTVTGLRGVTPAISEAALGMGMRGWQRLRMVEMPLALPLILAGIRQATVMVVAIATIGAVVGPDNLGRPIFAAAGRSLGSYDRLLVPVLLVAGMGVGADAVLGGLQWWLQRGRGDLDAAR